MNASLSLVLSLYFSLQAVDVCRIRMRQTANNKSLTATRKLQPNQFSTLFHGSIFKTRTRILLGHLYLHAYAFAVYTVLSLLPTVSLVRSGFMCSCLCGGNRDIYVRIVQLVNVSGEDQAKRTHTQTMEIESFIDCCGFHPSASCIFVRWRDMRAVLLCTD